MGYPTFEQYGEHASWKTNRFATLISFSTVLRSPRPSHTAFTALSLSAHALQTPTLCSAVILFNLSQLLVLIQYIQSKICLYCYHGDAVSFL